MNLRKLTLALALLAWCACAAQSASRRHETSVTATGTDSALKSQCTLLDGTPTPCPPDTDSGSAVPSPATDGAYSGSPKKDDGNAGVSSAASQDRCTTLDGTVVPCPVEGVAPPLTAPVTPVTAATNKSTKTKRAAQQKRPSTSQTASSSSSPASAPAAASAAGISSSADVPQITAACSDLSGAHSLPCPADDAAAAAMQPARSSPDTFSRSLPRSFLADQKNFWTSPLKIREQDLDWMIPFAAVSAVTIGSDRGIEGHLPTSATIIKDSKSFSNYALAGMVASGAGMFFWGHLTQNDHMQETGFLSGEATVNAVAVAEGIKFIAGRQRPLDGNGRGNFWSGGSSFPSIHSTAAWSIASVIAHEYPGIVPSAFAYGAAAAISATRVTGRQHFASDVLIGSALGWYMGRQVFRAHSAQGDTQNWGTFVRSTDKAPRPASRMGSPYVPLDTWVYPAFDRLEALGYLPSAIRDLRPWTRMECARLVQEAGDAIVESDAPKSAVALYRALRDEFRQEVGLLDGGRNLGVHVDSIYSRVTAISGPPLTDSYHFGQTLYNDYGRPYQEGFNMVTGTSTYAQVGPLAFFVRGEYQHAPSASAYSLDVRQAIALADHNAVQPAIPFATQNRFEFLDSYVALNLQNNQLSFGRQSLWWGPGQGTALMFTNNASPMTMLRWSRTTPVTLPSVFSLLGPMRFDTFLGVLDGHHFPASPFITGQKLSFKPTTNLEVGFSKITVFAGGNVPLNWHTFSRAMFDIGLNSGIQNADSPGLDVGDRRGGFDFSYRLPGLRKWLTLYSDSLVDDDPSPLASPRRAAINPGIYLSHVPRIPKLDFRAEAVDTDPNVSRSVHGEFIYWNTIYHDSHTNDGMLMGSWIGREGRGLQVSSTYWFAADRSIKLDYRNASVDRDFLGGGTLNDYGIAANWRLRQDMFLNAFVRYEHWASPLLTGLPKANVTTSIELVYRPRIAHTSATHNH